MLRKLLATAAFLGGLALSGGAWATCADGTSFPVKDGAGTSNTFTSGSDANGNCYLPNMQTDPKGNLVWNKATFRAAGTVAVSAMAASLTDLFTLSGSASKTIRVTNVMVCGYNATTATTTIVQLQKHSTADTGGTTGTAPTATALNGETVSGTLTLYTANPTVGTLVGSAVDMFALNWGTAGLGGCVSLDFGTRNTEAVQLSGTAQQFALNFGGVTQPSGGSLAYRIEWTEE